MAVALSEKRIITLILRNSNNTLFITINQSDSKNKDSHPHVVLEKRAQPNEFNINGVSQAWYLTSIIDQETAICLFTHHEINASPSKK